MEIAVFGLGYVGTVMGTALAAAGHRVLGVDIQPARVEDVNAGRCPIVEPGLDELFTAAVASGHLRATTDAVHAVEACEVGFVCVGTPSDASGGLDTTAVEAVCARIGEALGNQEGPWPVVIRSTVTPGTARRCEAILAEATGSKPGRGFTVLVNPEFLREGAAVADFQQPPFTLVGCEEPHQAEPLRRVYASVSAPFYTAALEQAEVLKALCNAWHATKISFANEVGRLCHAIGVDPDPVMDLFVRDHHLNISERYLRPGFSWGGSCLPKDVRALNHLARSVHQELPLLDSLLRTNRVHLDAARVALQATGLRRVAFLGLAFKPGTDDLRSSPLVDLAEYALGKGMAVSIYDRNVEAARLVGINRREALSRLMHLEELLVSEVSQLLDRAELFVLGHPEPEHLQLVRDLPADRVVLDLTGALRQAETAARYVGLVW